MGNLFSEEKRPTHVIHPKQYQFCLRDGCPFRWYDYHYHCNHPMHPTCEYTSKIESNTNRHEKLHENNIDLIANGFKRFLKHETCLVSGCLESKRSNHTHCLRPGCGTVIRYNRDLTRHKNAHEQLFLKLAAQNIASTSNPPGKGTPTPNTSTQRSPDKSAAGSGDSSLIHIAEGYSSTSSHTQKRKHQWGEPPLHSSPKKPC
ncbi:zinc finger protein castor homolog 1-like [Gigantopelta aegis]|uniref:zinc finger protein castor homolog 1-like n=1 Tax=Gigantopelta aegis TaxID=1735272 RepID=UPI001B88B4B8|nr:zinc finger protein castor homolog 1-like [Gigantopelta aegis]